MLRAARANTFRIHNQLSSQAAQAADRSRFAAAAVAAAEPLPTTEEEAAAAAEPNASQAEPSVAERSPGRVPACPIARLTTKRKPFEFHSCASALFQDATHTRTHTHWLGLPGAR